MGMGQSAQEITWTLSMQKVAMGDPLWTLSSQIVAVREPLGVPATACTLYFQHDVDTCKQAWNQTLKPWNLLTDDFHRVPIRQELQDVASRFLFLPRKEPDNWKYFFFSVRDNWFQFNWRSEMASASLLEIGSSSSMDDTHFSWSPCPLQAFRKNCLLCLYTVCIQCHTHTEKTPYGNCCHCLTDPQESCFKEQVTPN